MGLDPTGGTAESAEPAGPHGPYLRRTNGSTYIGWRDDLRFGDWVQRSIAQAEAVLGLEQVTLARAKKDERDGVLSDGSSEYHITLCGDWDLKEGDAVAARETLQQFMEAARQLPPATPLGMGLLREDPDANFALMVIVEWPALQELRCKHGWKHNYPHITVGFKVSDIHNQRKDRTALIQLEPEAAGHRRHSVRLELEYLQTCWLAEFFLPAQRKKLPDALLQIEDGVHFRIDASASEGESAQEFAEKWADLVGTASRKVEHEDLGDMDAPDLWEYIAEEGRAKLAEQEQEHKVKVVFGAPHTDPQRDLRKHVFLVGARPKLQKRCFVIRNVLSHYHWRLSGKDVAFEVATAQR